MKKQLFLNKIVFIFIINISLFSASMNLVTADSGHSNLPASNLSANEVSFPVHNLNSGKDFIGIQDAIDDEDTKDGHVIKVDPGIYYENINIYKSLSIEGSNKETTYIYNNDNTSSFPKIIDISANSVVIKGFTIAKCRKDGINVRSNYNMISDNNIVDIENGICLERYTSGNIITRNVIVNANYRGIYLMYNADHIVAENEIIGCGFAIDLDASTNITITSNAVDNNTLGIEVDDSSYNIKIIKNIISNNALGGIVIDDNSYNVEICDNIILRSQKGVLIEDSHDIDITNNIVKENIEYHDSKGVVLDSSINITITENIFSSGCIQIYGNDLNHWNTHNIERNFADGLPIYYYKNINHHGRIVSSMVAQVIIANCKNFHVKNIKLDNEESNIQIGFSSGIHVTDNKFTNKKTDYCLRIYSSNDNIIEKNIFSNNNAMQIHLFDSHNTIIRNNTFIDNSARAIGLEYSSDNIIADNIILNCKFSGISLGYSSENTIMNNNITNCSLDGINLDDSSNNTIIENQISKIGRIGVNVDNSWHCQFVNNIIVNNYEGIELYYSSDCIIKHNDVNNNICRGIFLLHNSNRNIIYGNNISNNGKYGIYITSSDNNNIRYNIILSNFCSGIVMISSQSNYIINDSIKGHILDGIALEKSSSDNFIHGCHILNNWRGIKIDSNSTLNVVKNCRINDNHWGVKLSDSEDNTIEDCTITNNAGGIMRGKLNFIRKNNFIDNKIFDAFGEWEHVNFWNRNYWSGHQTPLPYYLYGLNVDWLPKILPYNYPTSCDIQNDHSDNLWDWDNGILQERDFEELDNLVDLRDRDLHGLSSFFFRSREMLNRDVLRFGSQFDEHKLLHQIDKRNIPSTIM